jgi:hypothetical protein
MLSASLKLPQNRNRRGFYIYGPDFFFIPNKYWEVTKEGVEAITVRIRGTEEAAKLPRQFLAPTLREPAESAHELTPRPRHFVLVIPPERLETFPQGIIDYVRESERLHEGGVPAKESWDGPKGRWYAFVWKATRDPFGSIVIPEKFRPHQRGVAAHYVGQNESSENQLVVPVSFYTRDSGDAEYNQLIVAWLNSTIGLAFRFEVRSWLGAASERMSGAQLDEKLAIPRRDALSKSDLSRAHALLKSCPRRLPDFAKQYGTSYPGSWREGLDRFCLELCSVPETKVESTLDGCITVVLSWIRSSMGDPSWSPG